MAGVELGGAVVSGPGLPAGAVGLAPGCVGAGSVEEAGKGALAAELLPWGKGGRLTCRSVGPLTTTSGWPSAMRIWL